MRSLKPLVAAGGLLACAIAAPAGAQMATNPDIEYPAQIALHLPDRDLNWGELARFDNFLDQHPAIARDLYRDPGAIRNPAFLNSHPELREFLAAHGGIAAALRENPGWFMNREARFERFEQGHYQITRAQLDAFDDYLDAHPEVARQLYANPGLMRDAQFLAAHPQLATFLRNHPGIDGDLERHPYWTMWREHQFERSENEYHPVNAPTNPQVANFDDFLDHHEAIDQQLMHDPRLIDNPGYLANHPQLRDYLSQHPEVRAEIRSHPDWFMHRERLYEHHEHQSRIWRRTYRG